MYLSSKIKFLILKIKNLKIKAIIKILIIKLIVKINFILVISINKNITKTKTSFLI